MEAIQLRLPMENSGALHTHLRFFLFLGLLRQGSTLSLAVLFDTHQQNDDNSDQEESSKNGNNDFIYVWLWKSTSYTSRRNRSWYISRGMIPTSGNQRGV